MAIENQSELENKALEIRDETLPKANSASRVGTLLLNFIQSIYSTLSNKQDKVSGKGLSTEDFTTTEKNKLADLENSDLQPVYAQLANKVEQGDIDTAVDVVKGTVPVAGDSLKKLYDLVIGAVGVSASATDIADRDTQQASLSDQQNIYVNDASADATVTSGWAIYKYLETPDTFVKISEQESLDIVIQNATDSVDGLVKIVQDLAGSGADKAVSLDALKVEFAKYHAVISSSNTLTHNTDGADLAIDFTGRNKVILNVDHNIGALSFSGLVENQLVILEGVMNAVTPYLITSITNLYNDEVLPVYPSDAGDKWVWRITLVSGKVIVDYLGNIN